MFKIFIDGQNGTTGLQIKDRLAERGDIELIELLDAERKTDAAKRAALDAADVAILCLPDDAARQTAALAKKTRLIDARPPIEPIQTGPMACQNYALSNVAKFKLHSASATRAAILRGSSCSCGP